MGFDIECIIDIHNYPGEYFCPVCRTLVYPNEALQSQCTHLYCKPCLSHVANGTKACPYDGYLVTESDSKPLVDSDKTLVENIGKVKVHCLFFRSGCSWEGTLSECNSHCSACSFGNSPVICNRCGGQIVHRQVHEHAQSCTGGYEAQHAAGGVVGATGSSTTMATTSAEIAPTVTQAAAPLPRAQNTQTVAVTTPMPVQNTQPPLVVSGAVQTPEQQWYQQQYQQYYQQYAGYQLYPQPPQQYYPLQQQAYQQYQQQLVPVQPAQNQSNLHSQGGPQPQPQNQTHLVPQIQQQPRLQPQAQMLPQAQPQLQVPPSVPNYQVNHQLPHPPMQGPTPIPPQTVQPPAHGQVAPYPQAMSMHSASQHAHVPQYQQPQASQSHIQPQMHSQPLSQPPPLLQPSNQLNAQVRQQLQSYHPQPQTYPPPPPPQPIQANGPAPLPQGPHPPVPPVSGHHSYPQPQPTQQMQAGLPQQHPGHPHASGGSLNPLQAPQQPLMMWPPPSLGSLPQQQASTMVPLQNQAPSIPPTQNQQFPPHARQLPHSFQHRPAMPPAQHSVPQQYAQQQPFQAPFHGQSHKQGHFPQQPPHPYGPSQSQQSQSYIGRPVVLNSGRHPQTIPQSSGDKNPVQLGSKQTSINQNIMKSTMLEQNTMEQPDRSPSNRPVEKGFEQESAKKEATVGQYETVESSGNAANDGLSSIKQEEVVLDSSLDQTFGGKLSEAGMQDDRNTKEEDNLLKNSDSMKQEDIENHDMKVSKVVVGGMSSTYSDKQSHTAVSGSSNGGNGPPSKSHASFQQKPRGQFPAHSPSIPGPQGPGWREPGYFGQPPNNFESHSFNQRPLVNTAADPHGIIGRAPRPHLEGQFDPQHLAKPSGNAIFRDQRSMDGVPLGQIYNNEPSFVGANGSTAPESSMFCLRDEKRKAFAREHFDPVTVEPTQPFNQSLGYIGNASRGQNYDAASKLDSGTLGPHSKFPPSHHPSVGHSSIGTGPEFGRHHMKHFGPRNSERGYLGISPSGFGGSSIFPQGNSFADINSKEAHGFGEGSGSFNPSSEFRNPFPPSGLLQRFNTDGPGNLRSGDHMAPRLHNSHNRRDEVFGQDGSGHFTRKDFGGPGYFSGTAETAGPGAFPGRTHMTEFGTRNSYPGQGLPNDASFAGGPDPFDLSRKRRPMSTGWCRICKVDCETVEGLDMHSQTREHQMMAMDMVKTIKQQNKKKQRTSGVHIPHDGGRARKVGLEYHGKKP